MCRHANTFTESLEFGKHLGLNIFKGKVKKLMVKKEKVPFIGWNQINLQKKCKIFQDIKKRIFLFYPFLLCYAGG